MASEFRHNLAIGVCARQLRRCFVEGYDEGYERAKLQFMLVGFVAFVIVPALVIVVLGLISGWDAGNLSKWFCQDEFHSNLSTAIIIFFVVCGFNWLWMIPLFVRFCYIFVRDVIEHELTNFKGIPRDDLNWLGYGEIFKKRKELKKLSFEADGKD